MLLRQLVRALALASFLIACDANDPAGPNTVPEVADGVAVDAFIVMTHPGGGIHIVDPATGKASASLPAYYSDPVSAIEDGVAIAPDGQHIAWIKALGTVAVGVAKVVDGAPVLEVVKEYPDVTYQGVKWSPDGDRLVTTHAIIDPVTDRIVFCPDDDPTGSPIVLNETMVVFPGGYRYICPDGLNLYDDGAFVGHAGDASGISTADGQLFGLDFHQPSATNATAPLETDVLWQRGDLPHLMLPDGKTLVPPGDAGATADDGYVYDLPAIFTSRVWARSASDRWYMKEALDPFLHVADTRHWDPLSLVDNGRAVVFSIVSQIVIPGTPPEYIDSETAVVEVTRDGEPRGFFTSPLMDDETFIRLTDTVYDLVGEDWLVAGWTSKDNGQEPHLVGYVDGRQTHYRGFDTLTPDGRWFYGFQRYATNPNEGGQHCFYERARDRATCFLQVSQGRPIGLMGAGVKAAHAEDAPAVSGVSRSAAWTGAEVVVFGAHFGSTGTLTVGGEAAETVSWSPNQIRFRMPAKGGVVAVSNAQGTSGHRDFHVGLSTRMATPFEGMTTSEVTVGQGVNLLDLGDVALDGAAFLPVGDRYAFVSAGASPPATRDIALASGGTTRALRVHETSDSADASRWQPVSQEAINDGRDPYLADVGGLLVEVRQGRVPRFDGARVVVDGVDPRIFFGGGNERGLPDFWRNVPGGAFTASRFAENTGAAWSLRFLERWESTLFGWRPVYAASPRATMPLGTRAVAASGDTVLTTGFGTVGGGFQLSQDGGLTFTPYDAPTTFPLREPLAVEAATPFFLVLEADYAATGVKVHAVAHDGTFTSDVWPAMPAASLSQDPAAPTWVEVAQHAGKVALFFTRTSSLHSGVVGGDTGPAVLSAVRSIHQEGADLYAVMIDGSIQRSSDWRTFTPVDLGLTLALPTTVLPYALAKLEGRWLVLAKLFDGAEPSPIGRAALLVGPALP
jgi:hypothetical protein